MASVETYYLIDFENVHEEGLLGADKLNAQTHVHLFSTKNAPKISLEQLTHFNHIDLSVHTVPAHKQSVDMHLVSYLGYLIGSHADKKCKYVIISKDTDYDNIISFWSNRKEANITRQAQIEPAPRKSKGKSKNETPTATTATTTSIEPGSSKTTKAKSKQTTKTKNGAAATPDKKCQLNTQIQRFISSAGYDQSTINTVASIAVKNFKNSDFAAKVKEELNNTYTNGEELYTAIEPVIAEFSPQTDTGKTPRTATDTTSQLNSKIQKILSAAKLSNDITAQVASLVSKHHGEKNAKQTVYRAIIAKYGQKQGLDVYRHIKNHF